MATDLTAAFVAGLNASPDAESPHLWSSPNDMAWRAGQFAQWSGALPHGEARKATAGRGYSVNVHYRDGRKFALRADYQESGNVAWAA